MWSVRAEYRQPQLALHRDATFVSRAAAEARHVFMLDASFACLMFTCDVDSSAAAIFCEAALREPLLTGCCKDRLSPLQALIVQFQPTEDLLMVGFCIVNCIWCSAFDRVISAIGF